METKNKYSKTFAGREVNIQDYIQKYTKVNPEHPYVTQFNNASLIEFKWHYIGNLDPNDPSINNEGVRALQNSNTANIEELAYDYLRKGWSTDNFPPILKTNGDWEDGRTRILAALLNGEKWIPCAVFNFDSETPVADSTANSLIANNHNKSKPSTMEDFIVAGIRVVESGEIVRESNSIMSWLTKKAKIEDRFSNTGGQHTKIRDAILLRTSKEKELVVIKDNESWKADFVSNMAEYRNNPNSVLLLMANTGNSAWKFWTDHVLPNGGTPRPLILYTHSLSPAKCAEDVRTFLDRVERLHQQTYTYVNSGVSLNTELFSINAPVKLPFVIKGVIPNLKKNGQPTLLENYQLVDCQKYISDGSNISKTLKIVA